MRLGPGHQNSQTKTKKRNVKQRKNRTGQDKMKKRRAEKKIRSLGLGIKIVEEKESIVKK